GHNVPGISLLTMGEAWHNNHHAFPGSARLGIRTWQFDPGWWALVTMRAMGLVWNLKQPADLPDRPELRPLCKNDAVLNNRIKQRNGSCQLFISRDRATAEP